MGWIEQHAAAFQVLFSLVVTLATVFYVLLTRALVRETCALREAQTRPRMSVHLESRYSDGTQMVYLVAQNIGAGPAYNVMFQVSPDFALAEGEEKSLGEAGFMRKPHFFPPGRGIDSFLTSVRALADRPIPRQFTLTVTYADWRGRELSEEFPMDFDTLEGLRP